MSGLIAADEALANQESLAHSPSAVEGDELRAFRRVGVVEEFLFGLSADQGSAHDKLLCRWGRLEACSKRPYLARKSDYGAGWNVFRRQPFHSANR
jgi:hypothetical protein